MIKLPPVPPNAKPNGVDLIILQDTFVVPLLINAKNKKNAFGDIAKLGKLVMLMMEALLALIDQKYFIKISLINI